MHEKRQVKIKDKKIDYTLRKSSRIRYLRMTICDQGRLTITVPRGVALGDLEKFICQKGNWILDKLSFFKDRKKDTRFSSSQKEYLQKKEYARKIIKERVDYFCKKYGFVCKNISIRNQRTRWGSCSSRGNLSFHYKLAMMPDRYLDYVVAHELCHLKEMNHSRRFWEMVKKIIPDYQEIAKEMKKIG